MADFYGNVFKLIVALVAEQLCRFGVFNGWLQLIDVIGNVSIDGKNIEASVQVIVEEESAEGQGLYAVELSKVTLLDLTIEPDKESGKARAPLLNVRLA